MPYHVYILLCEDGSYYTGYAQDVESRFELHKKGHGARYTMLRKPVKIIYNEKFDNRTDAMKREKEIKSLNHNQKEQLINQHANSK